MWPLPPFHCTYARTRSVAPRKEDNESTCGEGTEDEVRGNEGETGKGKDEEGLIVSLKGIEYFVNLPN